MSYRLPGGKQRREYVGNDPDGQPLGIEEAKAAEGKRKAQKYENPGILEKVPAERMTFSELIDWYLNLKSVQKLTSFKRVKCIPTPQHDLSKKYSSFGKITSAPSLFVCA